MLITPAGEFDLTVSSIPGPVAGAIKPRAILSVEWMRNEFLSAQLRAIQVATTHPGAADVKLAGDIDRAGLLIVVKNVNLAVGDRLSNRQDVQLAIDAGRNLIERYDAGRFGLAKHMNVPRRMAKPRHPGVWDVGQQRLAGRKHQAQMVIQQAMSLFLVQRLQHCGATAPERRHRVHHRHSAVLDHFK